VKLLKNSPRYQNALQAGGDVRGFAQGLQKAGYATDPSYAA
jgi:flagellar protein FlgJ